MGSSHSSEEFIERKKKKHKKPKNKQQTNKQYKQQNKKNVSKEQSIDDMYAQQQQEIINEIERDPLVTQKIDILTLLQEFENNDLFTMKIMDLVQNKNKKFIRRTRKDGSCFYRCFIFMLFEKLIQDENLLNSLHLLDKIKLAQSILQNAGFERSVYIESQTLFENVLKRIEQKSITQERVEKFLSKKLHFDYLVLYLRFLVSAFIRTQRELFKCYFENTKELLKFCQNEVEPIDSECDQIQIMALHHFFEISIRIFYLDNSKGNQASCFSLPDIDPNNDLQIMTTDQHYIIQVVYRPGHYDMIYQLIVYYYHKNV